MTTPQDRLDRALKAPAAPAKDMHFTLSVMREAEARRFRAETRRRLVWGAAAAGLGVLALWPLAGWAADNADAALDVGLAGAGVFAIFSLLTARRRAAPGRAR